MNMHTKAVKVRCNNAVSAIVPLTQRSSPTTAVSVPTSKRHRPSGISRTVRVPNELVPHVNALVAAYRQRLHDDPDKWN